MYKPSLRIFAASLEWLTQPLPLLQEGVIIHFVNLEIEQLLKNQLM